ncbi:MAG TPA: hypothetical protein VH087_14625, partial [Thermoanaerobaculia bacterium]|jgi:hypothetical protein|nr:hypothetical protein [Thermoanaerobaculia bacterium]
MAKRVLLEFLAGFLATLIFHQPALWLLHLAGITPRTPYVMTAVPPFGVPAVISLAFWGGVWGLILIPAIARIKNEGAYWISAIVFGAIFPTLVAAYVVAPLKHQPPIPHTPSNMILGFTVNGAWGLGTALFFRLFARSR